MKRSCLEKSFTNNDDNVSNKKHKIMSSSEEDGNDVHSVANDIISEANVLSFTDTEAAFGYVRNILLSKNDEKKVDRSVLPPTVFVHQLYDIINNKTVVNRQIVGTMSLSKFNLLHLLSWL